MVSIDEIKDLAMNPVGFITTHLGSELWEKQSKIAESVANNRVTAVKSCHGSGKTFLAARISLWWLMTRPYSIVITTAPTARQVTELLWKEIRIAYNNAPIPLGGDLLPKACGLTIVDGWKMFGFSTDDPVNFQGHHAPGGVLVILDEAPGIAGPIWDAIKGVLVGPDDHMLAIGNPVESSGPFFDLFQQSGSAELFHISAFDVPNVKEGKNVFPGLCSLDWVNQMRDEWGEGTPVWASRVLGEFPRVDDNTLIPLSWMQQSEEIWRAHERANRWIEHRPRLGADIARLGKDKTTIAESYADLGVRKIHRMPKQDTMATSGKIVLMTNKLRPSSVRIDADGIGAGVFDRVSEVMPRENIIEMRGGMRASDPDRYFNARAEWYWQLRQRLDPDGDSPIGLPPDNTLRAQLTSIRYSLTSKGQIKIESKDEMARRGLKSPDDADAVVYGMAEIGASINMLDYLSAMTS